MKRSQINKAVRNATRFFEDNGWTLPPNPQWDVTDFGLGDFEKLGLVLVNLTEEPEYCEKLMYAHKGQTTPAHTHKKKKEDIICRAGTLAIQVWNGASGSSEVLSITLKVNGKATNFESADIIRLQSGERLTLTPGVYHEFYPESDECIIGEVSTANDDLHDNFFVNTEVGRFSQVEEDEAPLVKLVSD
ncbi:MAG: D-lyxose/D-mannose family sugar isomerase [Cyclobacteriaceae bacterium]|nr:D-lyxose/D-mannose family sugar isomerase [Cyclobacteriaceae bacterium]